MNKHYPIKKATKPLPKIKVTADKDVLQDVFKFLKKRKSVILYGHYAYNIYLNRSGIKKFEQIEIPYYEFVSIEYQKDGLELLTKLKEKYENIEIKEYYPLWTVIGYNAEIYHNNKLVARFIHYNHRCTPIQKVNDVQIGSFGYVLLMAYSDKFRARVMNEKEKEHYYNIMISHLVEMRNYFLKNNKKTIFDDTIFQEYITNCIGVATDPMMDEIKERDRKYREGKRVIYKYDPSTGVKEPVSTFKFPNSSGNPINNEKNLKIVPQSGGGPNLPKKGSIILIEHPKYIEKFIGVVGDYVNDGAIVFLLNHRDYNKDFKKPGLFYLRSCYRWKEIDGKTKSLLEAYNAPEDIKKKVDEGYKNFATLYITEN